MIGISHQTMTQCMSSLSAFVKILPYNYIIVEIAWLNVNLLIDKRNKIAFFLMGHIFVLMVNWHHFEF